MINSIIDSFNELAKYIIPLFLCCIPFYGLLVKKVKVYEVFVEGAKEGFTIAVQIIPYLVAILVAIGMFRASGALDVMLMGLTPILNLIGFPPENFLLGVMRSLSGSGSFGILSDLVNQFGPDSLFAKIGATMYGSSETTFYVLAVYFGSVGIKKIRYALIAGLIADVVGILSSVYICKFIFS
ncbi:spore maturation protein [Gloeothece verrucosa]|uniref:Nucleoside recognition domain protein n=1 Tax=Gloeothece verrucosa (strain PCC 7822) TaxID=497965 RepID=E0UE30_GLOV7|nr:spore maturation protein [Gloeothece verrucosa]ADN13034.1 nucleoside recognition domain protein [Gloeothece verrucosa PCC 7822]